MCEKPCVALVGSGPRPYRTAPTTEEGLPERRPCGEDGALISPGVESGDVRRPLAVHHAP